MQSHSVQNMFTKATLTPTEKRVAKALSKLLPPPHPKKSAKQVSLQGVTLFKEPKSFYAAPKKSAKQVSLQGVNLFKEPKEFYTPHTRRASSGGSKWVITCKVCGVAGHNSRTCSIAPQVSRVCPDLLEVIPGSSKRRASSKHLEDTLVDDFNPRSGEMKKFLLEQCKVWGIETN